MGGVIGAAVAVAAVYYFVRRNSRRKSMARLTSRAEMSDLNKY